LNKLVGPLISQAAAESFRGTIKLELYDRHLRYEVVKVFVHRQGGQFTRFRIGRRIRWARLYFVHIGLLAIAYPTKPETVDQ
jgi:hypothetical protein